MHFVGQSIVSQSLKTTNLMNGPPERHIHYHYMAGGPKTYVYYFNINYR